MVIGVEDETRKIVGVDEKEVFQIMDSIANAVSDSCQPQVIPDITFQTIENKCIVMIEVYPGANRPYYLKSAGKDKGAYIRVAGTTRPADHMRLKELEMEGTNLSWDELSCVGYVVKEEAIQKLCSDIRKYNMESVGTEEKSKSIRGIGIEQLLNWKILKRTEGSLVATNAFVLLTSNYFSFSKIQCALFKGNDRDIFIDKKEYSGPLYEQIAVYDNRVEVTSPGMLYGGLTLEEALNGRSKIRNKAVAEIFSRMEIIEEWGTGIRRIINRAKEYDLPEPGFLEMGDTFRVNLYRKADKKPIKADREKKILDYIQENGSISNKEARELLGLAESTTKRLLKQMVDNGKLNIEGDKRVRRYYERVNI